MKQTQIKKLFSLSIIGLSLSLAGLSHAKPKQGNVFQRIGKRIEEASHKTEKQRQQRSTSSSNRQREAPAEPRSRSFSGNNAGLASLFKGGGGLSLGGDGACLAMAKGHKGKPYVWGADGPGAFDCSGLVSYVLEKKGCIAPGTRLTSGDFPNRFRRATTCQPGDILWRPGHVAFYAGDGQAFAAIGRAYGVGYQNQFGVCLENPCK